MSVLLHSELTGEIIGAAFEVWRVLGYGFLEKVYENALVVELGLRNLKAQQQFDIDVHYKGSIVGHYTSDLLAASKVIVELKAEKEYNTKHESQLLNYLKATGIQVGLVFNFGEKRCEFKRLVM